MRYRHGSSAGSLFRSAGKFQYYYVLNALYDRLISISGTKLSLWLPARASMFSEEFVTKAEDINFIMHSLLISNNTNNLFAKKLSHSYALGTIIKIKTIVFLKQWFLMLLLKENYIEVMRVHTQ